MGNYIHDYLGRRDAMKALTLTQPWASLVAIGAKRIETRSWRTNFRGTIAIHAAKGFPSEAKRLCESVMVCRALGWPTLPNPLTQEALDGSKRRIAELPLGCVIATAFLNEVLPTVAYGCLSGVFEDYPDLDTDQERAFGNYDRGRYGWVLENVKRTIAPIPVKGALGLWDFDGLRGPQ